MCEIVETKFTFLILIVTLITSVSFYYVVMLVILFCIFFVKLKVALTGPVIF